jgi:endonuclease/exonuclease/phosphatase family metal-dependent hydrolase
MPASCPLPRRNFLKALGVAATTPWLAPWLRAEARPAGPDRTGHTVVTANIRVALPEDEAAGHGWPGRREFCAAVIRAQQPDIICLQEVLRQQFEDLQAAWPEFSGPGFHGPEMDAHATGYHGITKNPIFYSRARYELVSAGGFWLSETPHLPGSLSWGSARARHVNWVRLRARDSGRQFRVLNTHLDHVSQPAREKQIGLILAEGALYPVDFPQLLAGDFNVDATNPVRELVRQAGWDDTYAAIHGPADPGFTYHGFFGPEYRRKKPKSKTGKIDFIFARGPVKTRAAEIIKDNRDGRFPSDHYFVTARVSLD